MTSLFRFGAYAVRHRFDFLSLVVFVVVFSLSLRCGLCQSASPNAPTTESNEIEAGHSFHGEAFDEGPRQAAYLMQGMGNVHWKISTKSPMAQRFFGPSDSPHGQSQSPRVKKLPHEQVEP